MPEHTPGPWETLPHDKTFFDPMHGDVNHGYIFVHAGGILICDVSNANAWILADRNTHKANARLIAAAPDLLEALKAIEATACFGDCEPFHDEGYYQFAARDEIAHKMIRAISRVKGE